MGFWTEVEDLTAKQDVIIYSKPGCCLCDKAKSILLKVQAKIPFTLQEIDISKNQALMEKYQYVIPVVAINGHDVLVSKISEFRFRKALFEIYSGTS